MISSLGTPPNRGQTAEAFNDAADAFMAGLPQFVNELNVMGTLFNLATTGKSSTNAGIQTGTRIFILQNLPNELVSNGGFDTTTTGWSTLGGATFASVSGRLQVTQGISSSYGQASKTISGLTVGKKYTFSWTCASGTASSIIVQVESTTVYTGVGSSGTYEFTASATTTLITLSHHISNSVGTTVFFDDISLVESSKAMGYALGMPIVVASRANALNSMVGVVTAYAGNYLQINCSAINGSGTFADWDISLTAASIGAGLGTNTFNGVQNWNQGTSITSASTIDLTNATGNTVVIGSGVAINAITLGNGMMRTIIFSGAVTLNFNATTLQLNTGGANYTTSVRDVGFVFAANGSVYCYIFRVDGKPVIPQVVSSSPILPISASVASNALTLTLNPTTLDFRSSALTSGAISTRTISSALSLVISTSSTLGTISGVESSIAILAIDIGGTIELAAVNVRGGTDLSETGLITTVAEGGAGGADSDAVVYSTTARSNVPYRVVGIIKSTQTTAGTWATAPSTIQGSGGTSLSNINTLGIGQKWQDLTASRAELTTYYNTTGKPIFLSIRLSQDDGFFTLTVDGMVIGAAGSTAGSIYKTLTAIIPPNSSYSIDNVTNGTLSWFELR